MRCYCSCLRGDLGIILVRKVISISLLFPAAQGCVPARRHTQQVSSGWLLGTPQQAVRDSRISGIF